MDLTRPQAPAPYDLMPKTPSFTLTSKNSREGEPMPAEHSAPGGNVSPQLTGEGFPEETEPFLLTCFDPDAPTPSGYWHWVITDIPASVTTLEAGIGESDLRLEGPAMHLRNDAGEHSYYGAYPPAGDGPHRYYFAITALDTPSLELDEDTTPTTAVFTANSHTLARAVLMATHETK